MIDCLRHCKYHLRLAFNCCLYLGKKDEVNLEASLRLLASPGQHATEIPGHESADLVIRAIGCVFRMAEIEKRAVEVMIE